MKYYVYILLSQAKLRYYVGQTQDFEKRFIRHNAGSVPSTKSGMPWELIKLIELESRSEAMMLEHKIKKQGDAFSFFCLKCASLNKFETLFETKKVMLSHHFFA